MARCHHPLHEGGYDLVRGPDGTWTTVRGSLPPEPAMTGYLDMVA